MKRFLLFILLSVPLFGACSVTSPTSASTVSGMVNWTASVTSLSSAATVDWVFDDFRVIGHVTASPWTLSNYNTGWNLDGPGNVKIIVRDATGAVLCTSADVPFTTSNWGMGIALNSCSSTGTQYSNNQPYTCATSFNGTPSISGWLALDINGNFGADTVSASSAIDGLPGFGKTSPGGGGNGQYPTGSTYRLLYDTTKLPNGLHSFGWMVSCTHASTNCGMPQIPTLNDHAQRGFVGGVFNVQNSNGTVVTVLPNIAWITMAPGDTFQLTANLLTDSGTGTTTGACTLGLPGDGGTRCHIVQDNACLFPIATDPQFPSQCVAGITPLGGSYTSSITPSTPAATTLNTLQGRNYVTLSSSGLMTASSNLGLSYISIQDTTSGKISQPIAVEVKASKAVYHYGTCGSVYSTYHAGGNCPSTLLTWLQNYQITNAQPYWPDYAKSGASAFEASFHQIPYNGSGGTNYTTFANWKNAWLANWWNPLNAVLTGIPGTSAVLLGNEFLKYQPDAVEVQQGASAPTPLGGGAYAGCANANGTNCDPLGYELDQLAATNRAAAHFTIDEADATYGNGGPNLWFNFAQSYNMVADQHTTPATAASGLWQIVIAGCPTQCMATFYSQGPFNMYGGFSRLGGSPGYTVYVAGATNTFLNGNWATTQRGYYCTEWNGILQYNGASTRDGDCANNNALYDTWVGYPCALTGETLPVPPGAGSCSSASNGAGTGCGADTHCNGTYTVSSDASLVANAWGDGTGTCGDCEVVYEPGKVIRNDTYKTIVSKFQAHNIPTTWCTRAASDFTTDPGYDGNPAVADAFCTYISFNDPPSQPWGRAFHESYEVNYDAKWGQYVYNPNPTNAYQWRQDAKSYSTKRYGIPHAILIGINAESFGLGGRFPGCTNQMVSCANASTATNGIMTFIGAHNIPVQAGVLDDIKAMVNGVKAYVAPCTGLAGCTTPTTQVLTYTTGLASCGTGCAPSGLGNLQVMTGPYTGNTYAIPGWAGACYEIYFNSSIHLPIDTHRGTVVQITGSGTSPHICDGTYAIEGWQVTGGQCSYIGYCPTLGVITSTAASGQTVEINDDMGQMNPLYDLNQLGAGRTGGGGVSGYALFTAGLGYAAMRAYQIVNEQVFSGQWAGAAINDGTSFQATPTPNTPYLQQRFWDVSQGLNLVKRLAPLYLQTIAPAPVIGPGFPWLATSLETSSNGKILTTWNTSEMPLTATFNLGTLCQSGSNPISVYHASYPHSTTELLTGSQGSVTYTWDAGEAIVFACHASGSSFVNPYSVSFTLPGGATKAIATAVHGNYSGPLATYLQSHNPANAGADRATTCNSSPCALNIDTGQSDVYYQLAYVDASNNPVSPFTSGPILIPQGSLPPNSGGRSIMIARQSGNTDNIALMPALP